MFTYIHVCVGGIVGVAGRDNRRTNWMPKKWFYYENDSKQIQIQMHILIYIYIHNKYECMYL